MSMILENNLSTGGSFVTTNWSLVRLAGGYGTTEAEEALAALCETYWYPLFGFARRQGYDAAQAQDFTQGFFEKILEKQYLRHVDRNRGRFRSFLLSSFKHFIAKEHRAARAQKRGGDCQKVSIDFAKAEERYCQEPFHEETPERFYERQWAITLLDRVYTTLEKEQTEARRQETFQELKGFLCRSRELAYREVASRLGITEGGVKSAVHRLRKRMAELLREEVGRLVNDPESIEAEIHGLFEALRPPCSG